MRALRVKLTKDSQLCMTVFILSLVKYFYSCLQVCGEWRNQDNNRKTITLQVYTNINNLSGIFRFTMKSSTDDVHLKLHMWGCRRGSIIWLSTQEQSNGTRHTPYSEGCLRCGGGCLCSEPTQVCNTTMSALSCLPNQNSAMVSVYPHSAYSFLPTTSDLNTDVLR